jgi:hypothetical protein
LLSEHEIEEIAVSKGFVLRRSKLTGWRFLDLLMFTHFNQKELSLVELCSQLEMRFGIGISKQGVDNRFSAAAVGFLKAVLGKAIKKTICSEPMDCLWRFAAAKIKDSTSFQLPEDMAGKYPGSGGSASSAMIRIQFEYDLRTGEITDLSLHPFNDQDGSDAAKTIGSVLSGELVLRDLGYVSIKNMQKIEANGAYFLNRLQSSTTVYEKKEGKFVELDFKKTEAELRSSGQGYIEKQVYIGVAEKYPVRLLAELLPEEKKNERLRKANKTAQKKGSKVCNLYRDRAGLNLFITNMPREWVKPEQIRKLYTMRWQIELVFKAWKSIGEIHKVKRMKIERFECCLYAKLLWITVNWRVFWEMNMFLYRQTGAFLSLYKTFKSFKNNLAGFRAGVLDGRKRLETFLCSLMNLADKYYRCDKRKGKLSYKDLVAEFRM